MQPPLDTALPSGFTPWPQANRINLRAIPSPKKAYAADTPGRVTAVIRQ